MSKQAHLDVIKIVAAGLLLFHMLAAVICMFKGDYWKVVLFISIAQINFIGLAIICYLDAIYETRDPNQS